MIKREALAQTLALFGELVGKPISPGLLEMYHTALSAMTTEQFQARAKLLSATHHFKTLPAPADFLNAPDAGNLAAVASERVLQLVDELGSYEDLILDEHVDAQTMRAVEMCGGWLALCEEVAAQDQAKLGIWRSHFQRVWQAAGADRQAPCPVSLGRHSTQNAITGWLDPSSGVLTLPDRVDRKTGRLIAGARREMPWARRMIAYREQRQIEAAETALAVTR